MNTINGKLQRLNENPEKFSKIHWKQKRMNEIKGNTK